MSAPRPRPVTATVRKPRSNATYRPRKNVPLLSDSDGSTESLISCVNDSYGSEFDSESEEKRQGTQNTVREANRGEDSNRNNNAVRDDDSFSERIISEKSTGTSVTRSENTASVSTGKEPAEEIGPWEKWMLKKTESLHKLAQEKAKLQRLKTQQQKQQEIEKQEKIKKAERLRQEWLEQKDKEKGRAEHRQMLRKRRKAREEDRKKKEIEEKAEKKYNEWLEQKKKTDALRLALEREQEKLKELELNEKKKKSDDAFNAWLQKASQRMKSVPHSYAKCDGSLTGYYDSAASPSPSYFNPIPWQPVALPPSTSKPKVKTKGKRRRLPKNAWTLDN